MIWGNILDLLINFKLEFLTLGFTFTPFGPFGFYKQVNNQGQLEFKSLKIVGVDNGAFCYETENEVVVYIGNLLPPDSNNDIYLADTPEDVANIPTEDLNIGDLVYIISTESYQSWDGDSWENYTPSEPLIPSLAEVLDEGNTSGANDIVFDTTQGLLFDNSSRLREGTIDAGLGGNKGIAQICGAGYELKWEAGRLYVMGSSGNTIRQTLYNLTTAPTSADDYTKGYMVGSLWTLDDGTTYECISDGQIFPFVAEWVEKINNGSIIDITLSDLWNLYVANNLVTNVWYKVIDAIGNTKEILTLAISNSQLSKVGINISDGTFGEYTVSGTSIDGFVIQGNTVTDFTDLGDVPSSYTGQANKVVSVKNDETGLEFTTPTNGDITGNGADTQIAVFDAAKNIVGYVPLKFLKAASLTNREILQIGTPGTNNSSPGVLKLINPTTNTNNQSAAILIEHTDGTSEVSIVQFTKNASVGDGTNGHFEFSAAKRRGSVYFTNTDYPLCFFAPEINFGVRTFNANSIGMRLISASGLRLGLVEDIKGDTITPTAILDLSGEDLVKAPLRIRSQTATTSNIEAGNLEFNGSRLLLSLGTTVGQKEEIAYLSDVTSGGGDVYLANDQTFTGENTFSIGSGNDTPVTITKGGNNAALKVTKSSGNGDAIEVAEGSLSIADETASTIASFDANKRIKSLATSTYPSLTELAHVKGVGSQVVGTTDTNILTNKRITARTGTIGDAGATPTINTNNVDIFLITAQTVNITDMSANLSGTPTEGQTLWIAITGTAARTISWGTSFEASTITLPTTTVTTTRLDVAFIWNSVTSKWRCVGVA
jgi:hypothetical protein